jgi:hypothetical protein
MEQFTWIYEAFMFFANSGKHTTGHAQHGIASAYNPPVYLYVAGRL